MDSRRDFIGKALAGGFIASAATLPARGGVVGGKTVKDLSAPWGPALQYVHVNLGLEKPFSVLHISDTHLSAAYPTECEDLRRVSKERTECFGGMQEVALATSLYWAQRDCDYVVHTGDLVDFQSEANIDLVRKYLGAEFCAFGAIGNHEYECRRAKSGGLKSGTAAYNEAARAALKDAYPFDLTFASKVINGVNFVMLDNVFGTVTRSQADRFVAEVGKGLPIILCMHVPFFTDWLWRASCRYWKYRHRKFRNGPVDPTGDFKAQQNDRTTADFIAYLKSVPLLRGILTGHLHVGIIGRFSKTAMEYVVGGNYAFNAQEVLFL